MLRVTTILCAALLTTSACHDDDAPEPEQLTASVQGELQWKRYRQFEADLMRGLELDAAQVCQELGGVSCIQDVHRIALGGHKPIELGMYRPLDHTLKTTPVAVDRVLLSACAKRVELDAALGAESAVVFRGLELGAPAPEPGSAAVTATVETLYRRLLGRDPEVAERDRVAALASADGETVTGRDFATLACFAIGSTSEFLFF